MPNMIGRNGQPLPNTHAIRVTTGATTVQVSVSGDTNPGRDYCSHLLISGSTAAAGAVTLFDGTTALLVHTLSATVASEAGFSIPIDIICSSTKGFNITTGTSSACVFVGRIGNQPWF